MLCHFTFFLGVNGRKKELENRMTFIDRMTGFGLSSADDPKAASFSLRKRIETAGYDEEFVCFKDDFYRHVRSSFAAMYHFRSEFLLHPKIKLI